MNRSLDKRHGFGFSSTGLLSLLVPLLLVAALSACSGPQIRTHTLVPPPQVTGPDGNRDTIVVEHVSVPPQLNRTELILRKGNSQLLILESDWWGAPLPEEIRSALTARLNQSASTGSITRVWVSVTRFDAVPGQNVWLDADYRLAGNPDLETADLNCSIRHHNDAGDTVNSMVRAHQLNVEALAEDIVATAHSLSAGSPGCQNRQRR